MILDGEDSGLDTVPLLVVLGVEDVSRCLEPFEAGVGVETLKRFSVSGLEVRMGVTMVEEK